MTSTIKWNPAVQKYAYAPSAITHNTWIDDFFGLPDVTGTSSSVRTLLNYYSSSDGSFGTMQKRASDQKISFSGDIPSGSRVNVSGVIL